MSSASPRQSGTSKTAPTNQNASPHHSHQSKGDSKAQANNPAPDTTKRAPVDDRNDLARCLEGGRRYFKGLLGKTKQEPEAKDSDKKRLEEQERHRAFRQQQAGEQCSWRRYGRAGFRVHRTPVVPRPVCVPPPEAPPSKPAPKPQSPAQPSKSAS